MIGSFFRANKKAILNLGSGNFFTSVFLRKWLFSSLIGSIITLTAAIHVFPQSSNCPNLSFELGNFSYWEGHSWVYSVSEPALSTSKSTGIINRRHTIMSDTFAYDANTGYALKKVPKGYKYSARLGDGFTSSDNSFRCWEQSLRYSMKVDSSNALLVMKFACVLQYADNHPTIMEPRFKLTLYDSLGHVIPDCSNYDVYATNTNVKGFNTYILPSNNRPVKWRDWTTVGANLLRYLGQKITIEFMSADCTGHFHFGYAYFVAECHPLYITTKYCRTDTLAVLSAPDGFESYNWQDPNNVLISANRLLNVMKPVGGETYKCLMTSATGCLVSLNSKIAKYIPVADFSAYMPDCKSNNVQFLNSSKSTNGTLQYKWDFNDDSILYDQNPYYKFKTSGIHPVKLIVYNAPSSCTDTMKKTVESFSPALIGIRGDSTYCPDLSIYLKAYGAYEYLWNNGSKKDSIEVSDPGGRYWLIGRSSSGCSTDTIYKTVKEEPDWNFSSLSDTTLCKGDSTILQVSGGFGYIWDTNDTTRRIVVNKAGRYRVIGYNKRGCKKVKSFNVLEYPIPQANFTTSVNILDKKHNEIYCETTPEPDVQYFWDMGDGTIKTGISVLYAYEIPNDQTQYLIKNKAVSFFGCTDSTYRIIEVTPFIPNVFSPNGDGINDIFMQGFDIQICDRNGIIIYQGTEGWDGNYKGQPITPDTYFYSVQFTDKDMGIRTKKGYITLVR